MPTKLAGTKFTLGDDFRVDSSVVSIANPVSVLAFGAKGDGVTDDTAAIQTALNSGKSIDLAGKTYCITGLTATTNFQWIISSNGIGILKKNANGVAITLSGIYHQMHNVQVVGTDYTGDNIVATNAANSAQFINCASYGTPGRPLKATGDGIKVIGTCNVYQTTDATSAGYDIELGRSGTATLYHCVLGINTGQATGGILATDTGSLAIDNSQFGKLTVKAGTSPSGVNGGNTSGCRIIGDVLVEQSTSVFTGNTFSTQTITFAAGTSGHCLDESNSTSAATIVNNGNGNSIIRQSIGTGSPPGQIVKYGTNCTIRYNDTLVKFVEQNVLMANNKALQIENAAGTAQNAISLSTGNDFTVGADTGAGNFMNIIAGDGGITLAPGGNAALAVRPTYISPGTDAGSNCGASFARWNIVYAATGTIDTSDSREKQQIRDLSEAERAVAVRCKNLLRAFKFNNAVEAKSDGARIHFGVIAQDVVSAFAAEGLNATQYALLCYDEWPAKNAVIDKDGKVVEPARPAGNRYGVRYSELLAFIVAAI